MRVISNRPKSARFHDPRADYIHPPNGHARKSLDCGIEKNADRADVKP